MSRRAHSMLPPPPPPLDRDVIMGPPPIPAQSPLVHSSAQNTKDNREYFEKYYKLKRKYYDLEEKFKEMEDELRRSGDRNLRLNDERGLLLDRILELENLTNNGASSNQAEPHAPLQPSSTAYPRTLISTRAQVAFATNLREAMNELSSEDNSVDPVLTSHHVGPQARKRREEEMKERAEEEARESRKSAKRPRGSASTATAGKGKDVGAPLTFAPVSSPGGGTVGSPSHTLVSTSGKRIRIKPPAPAPADTPPSQAGSGPETHHGTQFIHNAGIPMNPAHAVSPGSPLSPLASDGGEGYMVHRGDSPLQFRNGHSYSMNSPDFMMGRGSGPEPTVLVSSSRPSDIQRHAKPKRLKAHTVTSKSYSIPTVPRNKDGGPLLPLNVGIMTVLNLGDVCMREHFHTERYIFPVNYEVTRRYLSARDPHSEVVYNCKILDGGDGPMFQIIAGDMPDKPIVAGTATGAWSVVVRAANHVRNRQHSNSVSGPDFFGLGQNTIKHLIQELPNADRLKDYVWQNFQEGGPLGGRHAAVIPALPEDYDSPNNGSERQDSKDSSAEYAVESDVPMADGRSVTEHHSYIYERRNSRASNGYPEDLPTPASTPHTHQHAHRPSQSPPIMHEHPPDHRGRREYAPSHSPTMPRDPCQYMHIHTIVPTHRTIRNPIHTRIHTHTHTRILIHDRRHTYTNLYLRSNLTAHKHQQVILDSCFFSICSAVVARCSLPDLPRHHISLIPDPLHAYEYSHLVSPFPVLPRLIILFILALLRFAPVDSRCSDLASIT
ncbi:hypothetical protein EVG20_g1934 [Dentipellis fragilis]|uniref:Transforming growth factor beta regulator 1 n=1 Tax=Dentipellis fragilis TaxID=205917 RepID=A0A4Y9ZB94_9AGAM|nr:hypothetical protein EVG20_g1934 [Dentipellis fragilis]